MCVCVCVCVCGCGWKSQHWTSGGTFYCQLNTTFLTEGDLLVEWDEQGMGRRSWYENTLGREGRLRKE